MLKREIKYRNFNDEEVSEVFYFNLSKSELLELEVEHKGGMAELLRRIVETNDRKELIKQFKDFILMTYGVKSDDGRQFIKNDQLRESFSQMAAFHTLFMELATDADKGAEFMKGVVPQDMVEDIVKEMANNPNPLGVKST